MKLEKDYKRKLQLKILDIVKDIDDVCKKNNIESMLLVYVLNVNIKFYQKW